MKSWSMSIIFGKARHYSEARDKIDIIVEQINEMLEYTVDRVNVWYYSTVGFIVTIWFTRSNVIDEIVKEYELIEDGEFWKYPDKI